MRLWNPQVQCPPIESFDDVFTDASAGVIWRAASTGVLGEEDRARFVEQARGFPESSRPRRFYEQLMCELLMFAGEREGALAALEASVASELEDIAWMDHCPMLAPLRGDPRFAAAHARVRVRADAIRRAWEER
jgi:hypothetical protein